MGSLCILFLHKPHPISPITPTFAKQVDHSHIATIPVTNPEASQATVASVIVEVTPLPTPLPTATPMIEQLVAVVNNVIPTPDQIKSQITVVFGTGLLGSQALCIAKNESGYRWDAVGYNTDRYHSMDRGVFQINSHWHPDVSANQAFDYIFNIQYAYTMRISQGNWSAWKTAKYCV